MGQASSVKQQAKRAWGAGGGRAGVSMQRGRGSHAHQSHRYCPDLRSWDR